MSGVLAGVLKDDNVYGATNKMTKLVQEDGEEVMAVAVSKVDDFAI